MNLINFSSKSNFYKIYYLIYILLCFVAIGFNGKIDELGGFLFYKSDRFHDFYGVIKSYGDMSYKDFSVYPMNYLPTTFYLVKLFNFSKSPFLLYLLVSSILFFYVIILNKESLKFSLPLILMFPVLFTIDRGNLEIIICLVIFLSFQISISNYKFKYFISALLIFIATTIKIFPIIFLLIIPLNKKNYFSITIAFIISLIPTLLFFTHNLSTNFDLSIYNKIQHIFMEFTNVYYIKDGSLAFSHSFWNLYKTFTYALHYLFSHNIKNLLITIGALKIYYFFALILGFFIFYLKSHFDIKDLFLLLSIYYVTIPPSGAEYTLVLIVLNLFIILNNDCYKNIRLLYLILLLPFSLTNNFVTTFISVFKSLILLIIFFKIIEKYYYNFKNQYLHKSYMK